MPGGVRGGRADALLEVPLGRVVSGGCGIFAIPGDLEAHGICRAGRYDLVA